jgi:hypothetical protein
MKAIMAGALMALSVTAAGAAEEASYYIANAVLLGCKAVIAAQARRVGLLAGYCMGVIGALGNLTESGTPNCYLCPTLRNFPS